MVQINDTTLLKDMKNGIASNEEVASYLMRNYTVFDIANALAEIMINEEANAQEKLPVSEEQLAHIVQTITRMFRVKGLDGRGRPKKVK